MAVIKTERQNLGSGSIKFIDGIEIFGIGSAGFDADDSSIFVLNGDSDQNNYELIGGDGHDELTGGGGNDILREGLGNGILNGGDGNDDLDGGPGTEKLFGGNGDDILRVGGSIPANTPVPPGKPSGDYDRLDGGAGSDTFGFYGVGSFEIADFELGVDRLFFDSSTLGVHDVGTLVSFITKITPPTVSNGYVVEFVGGAATIELIGVDPNSITADMIVFTL